MEPAMDAPVNIARELLEMIVSMTVLMLSI